MYGVRFRNSSSLGNHFTLFSLTSEKFNFLPAFNCTTWQLQLYHHWYVVVHHHFQFEKGLSNIHNSFSMHSVDGIMLTCHKIAKIGKALTIFLWWKDIFLFYFLKMLFIVVDQKSLSKNNKISRKPEWQYKKIQQTYSSFQLMFNTI